MGGVKSAKAQYDVLVWDYWATHYSPQGLDIWTGKLAPSWHTFGVDGMPTNGGPFMDWCQVPWPDDRNLSWAYGAWIGPSGGAITKYSWNRRFNEFWAPADA